MKTSARTGQVLTLGMVLVSLLTGCPEAKPTPEPTPTNTAAPVAAKQVRLPGPRLKGPRSLEEALSLRRSIRAYTDEPLSLADIAQLFWAAQGVTRSWGGRTAPSAGALYPLEIYAATAEGVYHYVPAGHSAELTLQEDTRQALWDAGLSQEALLEAPVIFVITAIYDRTSGKYGTRAERYVKLEAGHAAQNLLLQAAALDLGAVPIGAFYDGQVATALQLAPEEEPLYLIPVGHSAE